MKQIKENIFMPYVFSNININEEFIIQEIVGIYEAILGKKSIKQNCKFTKTYL